MPKFVELIKTYCDINVLLARELLTVSYKTEVYITRLKIRTDINCLATFTYESIYSHL